MGMKSNEGDWSTRQPIRKCARVRRAHQIGLGEAHHIPANICQALMLPSMSTLPPGISVL